MILVEPPGGAPQRDYEPFVDDVPDPERSLWWWHYNTNKFGVVVDLDDDDGRARFRDLVAQRRHRARGRAARVASPRSASTTPDLRAGQPALIWASLTPFGRDNPRAHEPATDLTVLATGGPGVELRLRRPLHPAGARRRQPGLPDRVAAHRDRDPRRGAAPRRHRRRSVHRREHARGGRTSPPSSRATRGSSPERPCSARRARHASARPDADDGRRDIQGRFVPTGVPPRSAREFQILIDWIDDIGWRDDYPEVVRSWSMGRDRGGVTLAGDARGRRSRRRSSTPGAARCQFIASRLTSYEFFVQGQRRGMARPGGLLAGRGDGGRALQRPAIPGHGGAPRARPARDISPALRSSWRHRRGGFRRHAPRLGEHQPTTIWGER